MDTLSNKDVITRKEHKCWGCMRLFPPKTKMQCVTSIDAGEIGKAYWCKDCQDYMVGLDYWELADGFCEGDLLNYDDYREQLVATCV